MTCRKSKDSPLKAAKRETTTNVTYISTKKEIYPRKGKGHSARIALEGILRVWEGKKA